MVIRPSTFQDKDSVLDLLKRTQTFNESELRTAMEVFDDAVLWIQENEYQSFCGVCDGGRIVGYICFGQIPMTDCNYDIYWIAIDRDRFRMGIGSKLLSFIESIVVKNKGRKIYLDTSSTEKYSAARSFYAKHGYRIVSVLEDYYCRGDHKVIFMKDIDSDHVKP